MNYKLRKISLRFDNGTIKTWNPLDINRIEFHKDCIRINDESIEKKDVDYSHWEYFILQLIRIFEIKRFKIET